MDGKRTNLIMDPNDTPSIPKQSLANRNTPYYPHPREQWHQIIPGCLGFLGNPWGCLRWHCMQELLYYNTTLHSNIMTNNKLYPEATPSNPQQPRATLDIPRAVLCFWLLDTHRVLSSQLSTTTTNISNMISPSSKIDRQTNRPTYGVACIRLLFYNNDSYTT